MEGMSRDGRGELAERIDRLARARGWTTAELASRAKVEPAQIAALGEGVDVGVSVLVRLAGALEVEVDELVRGIGWDPDGGGGSYPVEDPEAGDR